MCIRVKSRLRLVFLPLAALLFVLILLIIENFNGAVQSHHLLNNPNLPAISNWFAYAAFASFCVCAKTASK